MKLLGAISTAVLSLTLGATALAYPQQEQRDQPDDKDKSAHQDEKKDEKKAQPEKPSKQEEKATPKREENVKPEEKAMHQEPERTPQAKPEQQMKPEQQQQQARGGDRGGRIPDDRYKANFGREHTFHVSQGDYGNRRFQYGGYWFGFASAWPSNWLYTQDVYVIEIDGVYYLCNPNYPGVNVELNVTM